MKLIEMPDVHFAKIKKGTIFIEQGKPVEYIYYLTNGYFYRIMTTIKGDEVIYGIKSASENFEKSLIGVFFLYGENASLTHQSRIATTDFIAMTDCDGYIIPKDAFYAYAMSNPKFLSKLLDVILDEYTSLSQNYLSHQEHSVANRLCQLLLEYSKPNRDNTLRYITVKNVDLAGFLGVHKVTVARIIKALKEKNILQRRNEGLIIVSVPELEQYANGTPLIYH